MSTSALDSDVIRALSILPPTPRHIAELSDNPRGSGSSTRGYPSQYGPQQQQFSISPHSDAGPAAALNSPEWAWRAEALAAQVADATHYSAFAALASPAHGATQQQQHTVDLSRPQSGRHSARESLSSRAGGAASAGTSAHNSLANSRANSRPTTAQPTAAVRANGKNGTANAHASAARHRPVTSAAPSTVALRPTLLSTGAAPSAASTLFSGPGVGCRDGAASASATALALAGGALLPAAASARALTSLLSAARVASMLVPPAEPLAAGARPAAATIAAAAATTAASTAAGNVGSHGNGQLQSEDDFSAGEPAAAASAAFLTPAAAARAAAAATATAATGAIAHTADWTRAWEQSTASQSANALAVSNSSNAKESQQTTNPGFVATRGVSSGRMHGPTRPSTVGVGASRSHSGTFITATQGSGTSALTGAGAGWSGFGGDTGALTVPTLSLTSSSNINAISSGNTQRGVVSRPATAAAAAGASFSGRGKALPAHATPWPLVPTTVATAAVAAAATAAESADGPRCGLTSDAPALTVATPAAITVTASSDPVSATAARELRKLALTLSHATATATPMASITSINSGGGATNAGACALPIAVPAMTAADTTSTATAIAAVEAHNTRSTGATSLLAAPLSAGARGRAVVAVLSGAARENDALSAELAVLRRAHAATGAMPVGASEKLAEAAETQIRRELADARAAAAALAVTVPQLQERAEALERRDKNVQVRLATLERAAYVRRICGIMRIVTVFFLVRFDVDEF